MSGDDRQRPPARRLLYLMHVDARWIRQRPHFLADELRATGRWTVEVRFVRAWRRHLLAAGPGVTSSRALLAFPPVTDWVRWRLNGLLARLQLTVGIWRRPVDLVWVTHPRMWECVPARLRDRVVYDAMDIASAFPGQASRHLLRAERQLCSAARLVLCSSPAIGDHLREQYGVARTHLLPNAVGWTDADLSPREVEPAPAGGATRLLYFGTVSEWLDTDLLVAALERYPDVEVLLVGPRDTTVPAHPRLTHRGPVPHGGLPAIAAGATALVMPFHVTELIKGVDPVKLYEYVALAKPVISCWYPGLERFVDHVNFYRCPEEFMSLLERVRSGDLTAPDARGFVQEHTWATRAGAAASLLAAVDGDGAATA